MLKSKHIVNTELDPLLVKKKLIKPPASPSSFLPEPSFEEQEYQEEQKVFTVPLVLQVAKDLKTEAIQAVLKAEEVQQQLEEKLGTVIENPVLYMNSLGNHIKEGMLTPSQMDNVTLALFSTSNVPETAMLPEVNHFKQEMNQIINEVEEMIPSLESPSFSSNPSSGWYFNWMERETDRVLAGKSWLERVVETGKECVVNNLIMAMASKMQDTTEQYQDVIEAIQEYEKFLKAARVLLVLSQLRKRLTWENLIKKSGDNFTKSVESTFSRSIVRYATPLFMSITDKILDEVHSTLSSNNPLMSQLMPCILDPITEEIEKLESEAISAINHIDSGYKNVQACRQAQLDLIDKKQGHQNAVETIDSFLEVLNQLKATLDLTKTSPNTLINQLLLSVKDKVTEKQNNGKISGTMPNAKITDVYWKAVAKAEGSQYPFTPPFIPTS